ncbi:hypothetical protein AJ80_01860 [Polytolypa hystricis UAMH7299]|uniref:Uncharacterized protein n=1 Tax=Polytolypa hystricis (strain UAMH7299) TaxID=1447883 RepID=A0A2B7YXZ9_POLH7|nr:hypothetical protein AJ80_01860 [Polytolypa hystricis UAMH7299]
MGQANKADISVLTLEMAMTCYSTFDVDEEYLEELVCCEKDVADITECSITIHDRLPPSVDSLPKSTRTPLRRYWRTSHSLAPLLVDIILQFQDGLHGTIGRLWANYSRGTPFSPLHRLWLATKTSNDVNTSSAMVVFNVLDGTLLINGVPLTRLPRHYEQQDDFLRLFGERSFDVVPSTMPGMDFETRHEHFGHQIHFGMHDGNICLYKTTYTDFGLIPPLLNGVQSLVHGIRQRRVGNWKGVITAITLCFLPLESLSNLHIILDETGTLRVHLPRLKLDFVLRAEPGELESRQFRRMVMDADQSFGAFTGLLNKLVLRSVQGSARGVIIPHGNVTSESNQDHLHVRIDTGEASHVNSYFYMIDPQLGCLVDDGSLRCKLFKCYLHALTANCFLDSLTGKTGTEEALEILSAASTKSLVVLDQLDIELLLSIAQLAPNRQFYPAHEKSCKE